MNTQVLIDSVVQRTMVFIAQLATAGGVRAPLAHVANQIFLDLTQELEKQGVRKKVIADMFGMALRSYHRKTRELRDSRTDVGRTLWEAIYGFLREREPVSAAEVRKRFYHDDSEIVVGVLNDLVGSGLAYRTGRGEEAVYRIANEADFADQASGRREANEYVVWLTVYRNGPIDAEGIAALTRLPPPACREALEALVGPSRVRESHQGERTLYESDELDVPLGTSNGWEAAVLDHFQAMVSAMTSKLAQGSSRPKEDETVGGSTWSLDVWPGHPLEHEAVTTLSRVRREIEDLRQRIDTHNAQAGHRGDRRRVVFYMGQYVRTARSSRMETPHVDEREEADDDG